MTRGTISNLLRIRRTREARGLAQPSTLAEQTAGPREVYNALATLRFVGVVLVVTLAVVIEERVDTPLVAVATAAALLSVVIVALGGRLASPQAFGYVVLTMDMALAIAGVLVGGGIDSPFLFYALLPVLTSAILLNRAFTAVLAVMPGMVTIAAHTLLSFSSDRYAWILEGNYLTLVPVYAAVSLAVAVVPFYANLNLRGAETALARRSEQRRLRAELHDKLAQSLAALTMGLRQMRRVGGSAQEVGDLADVSERSYAELRELLDLLEAGSWQPTTIGTLGRLAESWSELSGVEVVTSLPDGDLRLPPEAAIAILGIAREALNNVGKHASAERVWVTLTNRAGRTDLLVRDDGRGFAMDKPMGHGRRIMAERAESIGASLEITSAPGEGTEVRVSYTLPG